MQLTIFQVDAFAQKPFEGNPAAVCPCTHWLPDELMQSIAAENNLSETAFFVENDGQYHIRWFTPKAEVDLCGHATLAAAHVIFNYLGYERGTIEFQSRSGLLTVENRNELLWLDMPADTPQACEVPNALVAALGILPIECYRGRDDYMAIFRNEAQIQALRPDMSTLAQLNSRGLIVTAPGSNTHFVSRWFGPQVGISEDPVTGSAHTLLVPYWANRLVTNFLQAEQVSARGGRLDCEFADERVKVGGSAYTVLVGQLFV